MVTALVMAMVTMSATGEVAADAAAIETWTARVEADLANCEEDTQRLLGLNAAITMLARGQYEEAEILSAPHTESFGRANWLVICAAEAATRGDMAVVEQWLKEAVALGEADRALSAVAVRLSQRGDDDASQAMIARIVDPKQRDYAIARIEQLPEQHNDLPISRDMYVNERLVALGMFVDSAWTARVVAVLRTVQDRRLNEMRQLESAVLDDIGTRNAVEQTFTHLALAVAHFAIEEPDEALAALRHAQTSAAQDITGTAALYGDRVQLYLLAHVDESPLLDQILGPDRGEQADDALEVLGVMYAEQHRFADADALHAKLTRPEDRARFALGVLMGMLN